MSMILRCASCAAPVNEGEQLCSSCGADFKTTPPTEISPSSPPIETPLLPQTALPESAFSETVQPESTLPKEELPEPVRPEFPLADQAFEPIVQRESNTLESILPPVVELPQEVSSTPKKSASVPVAVVAGVLVGIIGLVVLQRLSREKAPLPVAPTTESTPIPTEPTIISTVTSNADRPAATFGTIPSVVVASLQVHTQKPKVLSSDDESDETQAKLNRARWKGPLWTFEGSVIDFMTGHGIFAAKLVLVDPSMDEVAEVETNDEGHYKISVPALAAGGYTPKLIHQDYTPQYIDDQTVTASVKDASTEQRRILMHASVRHLPWTGKAKSTIHRDIALIPPPEQE